MATREQINANRRNARLSTGPRRTDRTRFNGLTHGLCATEVVIPGEDPAEFELDIDLALERELERELARENDRDVPNGAEPAPRDAGERRATRGGPAVAFERTGGGDALDLSASADEGEGDTLLGDHLGGGVTIAEPADGGRGEGRAGHIEKALPDRLRSLAVQLLENDCASQALEGRVAVGDAIRADAVDQGCENRVRAPQVHEGGRGVRSLRHAGIVPPAALGAEHGMHRARPLPGSHSLAATAQHER